MCCGCDGPASWPVTPPGLGSGLWVVQAGFSSATPKEAIMSKTQSASKPTLSGEKTSAPVMQGGARKRAHATNPRSEAAASKPTSISEPSKSDRILKLLRRKKGASVKDLQEATGWQAHSVRGFLSGTVKKRLGLPLQSEHSEKGGRRYLIAEA
jgi:hypothetical protein